MLQRSQSMDELIDFHCHLDLYENFEHIVQECEKKKVFTLAVTTTPRAWPRNHELTQKTKYVRAGLGLHPQLINNQETEIDTWEMYFPEATYIGEVGLDASPKYYPFFATQQTVFDKILSKCSRSGGKILSVHSVRCASKVLDALSKSGAHLNNKIVLHWFSGSAAEVKRATELGCYFSVNVAMLSSDNGKKLLNTMPLERIITETDGPFTHWNNKVQYPWDISICIELLSNYYNVEYKKIRSTVYRNFASLLFKK